MQRVLHLAILAAVALSVQSARAQSDDELRVRLTYYIDRGVTASGGHTAPGVAACSSNFPFGTVLRLPDGRRVRCEDRGRLTEAWVDVWVGSTIEGRALAGQFGDWVVIVVEQWGDGR